MIPAALMVKPEGCVNPDVVTKVPGVAPEVYTSVRLYVHEYPAGRFTKALCTYGSPAHRYGTCGVLGLEVMFGEVPQGALVSITLSK